MMKKAFLAAALAAIIGITPTAEAAEWEFDKAHTQIKFRVKHLMVANVWGDFDEFQGTILYDPDKPQDARVNVTIDINSIDTGNDKRDGHLKSEDFFYAEKYPTMTFESTKVSVDGNGLKVTGDLTIRGVTKEITLDVEGPHGPVDMMGTQKIAATATANLNRTDFGLNWNKVLETGGVVVDEMVHILLEVELNKVQ
jgi:polyisoprenoid-binding protein YceI